MKKFLIALLLLIPVAANAQNITTTTCPGAGCIDFPVGGQGSIGIQVTGTWVGTLTFSATVDGTNFVTMLVAPAASGTAVSTSTANGVWTAAVAGITTVRVAFTAFTSGTATVTRRTTQAARNGGTSGGGGGGSGTVTSVGLTGPDVFTYGAAVTTSGDLSFTPTDPGADRIVFWDDSASKWVYLTVGDGLAITTTTLAATGTVTNLTVDAGLTVNGVQTCTTANCTLALATPIVYCDATSNSVSLNLPDSQAGVAFYSIQRIDSTAGNTCTLDGDSADTINNNATYLVQPDVSYSLIGKTTSAWRITSSFLPSVPGESNLGTVGSTETIDFAGNYRGQYIMTLDENLTLTFSNPVYGASYTLIFTQDGSGTNTVTWPAAVLWSDGSAPTITATASKSTLCVLTYTNAQTNKYFGACNLNY